MAAETSNGDYAAQQAQAGREARRFATSPHEAEVQWAVDTSKHERETGKPTKRAAKAKGAISVPKDLVDTSVGDGPERRGLAQSDPNGIYLKVNTPNEYPQSSWGHIGRRAYGGSK